MGNYFSAGILTMEDLVLLRKRPEGVNAGKWELPMTAIDMTCESFRKAAARMISGEMKIPMDRVETFAVQSNEFEGYEGNVDITFFMGMITLGTDLSRLESDGWKLISIRSLTQDAVVPEHEMVFEALGANMAATPDAMVPVERN